MREAAGPMLGAPIATPAAADIRRGDRAGNTGGGRTLDDSFAGCRPALGMEQEMDMRPIGLLVGAALALAACAGSQPEPLTISDVTVDTDLTAVGSREAVAYWQGLSGDLETAIANQFVGRIDPAGDRITVDVDEISLNSPFTAGASAETARLSGRVELLNPAGTSEGAYDVTASAQDVADFLPTGSNLVSVPPTSAAYYQAIVQAFARGVSATLSAEGS